MKVKIWGVIVGGGGVTAQHGKKSRVSCGAAGAATEKWAASQAPRKEKCSKCGAEGAAVSKKEQIVYTWSQDSSHQAK